MTFTFLLQAYRLLMTSFPIHFIDDQNVGLFIGFETAPYHNQKLRF